ncbi:tail assembly chaperone [Streptomyces phage Euratis]|uniref:Tail assembly chaperone n=1 Tax=Streptomyces phage Euratis TaxID=2510569 RepID=A0A411B0Z0_9CAUD|nr:tail assembly chaperone [Streptomyces phage Euratis]
MIACARLISHFRGLTWSDVRGMELQDFNALVAQMAEDIEEERKELKRAQRGGRSGGSAQGERRTPVMT